MDDGLRKIHQLYRERLRERRERAQFNRAPGPPRSTPSPPAEGGEGWGEEGRWVQGSPLSPALSPLVPRGEREKLGGFCLGTALAVGWKETNQPTTDRQNVHTATTSTLWRVLPHSPADYGVVLSAGKEIVLEPRRRISVGFHRISLVVCCGRVD